MIDPDLRQRSNEFAQTIADELERPDQTYMHIRDYGYGAQVRVLLSARDMIERYIRRAIEADRKVRPCPDAE